MSRYTQITFEPTYEETLVEEYGNRAKKALRLAEAGKVKHYLDFCVVEGDHDNYTVEGTVCSCPAYQFNVTRGTKCSHVLAVEIAQKKKYLVYVNDWWADHIEI